MRQIFIGDVQGCCGPLERLLDRIDFDPSADRLRLCGDLVNRGGRSLATLRLVHSLRDSAVTVLGNHDLHLLAYAHARPDNSDSNPEFDTILAAADGDRLLQWLRSQPVLWTDPAAKLAMVHAGVDPRWDPMRTTACARQLETALAGDDHVKFFRHMYGNRPRRWKAEQGRWKQLRAITNVFTRLRFCDAEGRLDFEHKGSPEKAPGNTRPWFRQLHPGWSEWTIIFGHWSVLGLYRDRNAVGLDTGCVWGKQLTALIVENGQHELVQVSCSGGCA